MTSAGTPRERGPISARVSSLHVGGCAACAQSVTAALEAPQYASIRRALGVSLARAPRHCDIILLSGALTEQAKEALNSLLAGVPRPRALVAIGDCAVNGCVFSASPRLTQPLAQAFGVNVELGGCPPPPEAIMTAIAEAQRLLASLPASLISESPAATTEAPNVAASPKLTALAEIATDSATASSQPILPVEKPQPDPELAPRAERLAALFQAANAGWDEEDGEEDGDEDDFGDAPERSDADDGPGLERDLQPGPHDLRRGRLTETRPSTSEHQRIEQRRDDLPTPAIQQHKEKRR